MGKLVYGNGSRSFEIEDRTLAHLRVVFMNKLRRGESFMFHHTEPHLTCSVWMDPSVPFILQFHGSRQPTVNRDWVEALMQEASSANGLRVVPEPAPGTALLADAVG
ncbi:MULTISPECIES: ATP-dependent DNA ligase [unclassified Microbacterium]|uniref:DUF7882 family protein n=1 Tax=unclassified Microbacterium TaxID=2609290 RepID=UPI00214B98A5|nr:MULTISPECIES: ATP-dependent DNA ligase [unclassified Microbacterium]MCR2783585.1 ATP-dependent DNA ligase [Microbacterium sp. zg.B96]WIM15556.1 ATP-dependent DNA ligase [Microbacterium sp. zg-B96]